MIYGVIPARLPSTRLPDKLLLSDTGKPLLQYTWEAACKVRSLDAVVIATDSEEIANVAKAFGADVRMTGEHSCGTDRIAEVIRDHCPDASIVVNIQGDEPEIDPAQVDLAVARLTANPVAGMSTLATPLRDEAAWKSASAVKVVLNQHGQAMYFSRAPIPFCRDGNWSAAIADDGALLHIGLYAYRRDVLLQLAAGPPGRYEPYEKLEQLRALEHGVTIEVAVVDHPSVGIDTPEDYARFVDRMRSQTG